MGSAIACRAIGRDYSEHDLTPDELARVESMTADECRLRCEQQISCTQSEAASDCEYRIAYMLEATGEFEVVETFQAATDADANAYAEANHDGEWYVLDADGNNING
jgi:hypothetical protein